MYVYLLPPTRGCESISRLGKPIFFGELGADVGYDYITNMTANTDNPILIWCLVAVKEITAENYGFHGFLSGACTNKYVVVPEDNPLIIAAFMYYNGVGI